MIQIILCVVLAWVFGLGTGWELRKLWQRRRDRIYVEKFMVLWGKHSARSAAELAAYLERTRAERNGTMPEDKRNLS